MRKALKNEILQVLDSIDRIHLQVEKTLEDKKAEQAAAGLVDCQNAAIAVGTSIDNSEGEGTDAVKQLEEYCELIYHIHESILSGEYESPSKIYKKLNKKYLQIRNNIAYNIPVRKEVVFLPYKASMWDSLESVWRKCCEDPECDVNVIPIPYFDKNPDGSPRQLHYEGSQYPKDVPVIHYENYNLEESHPDEIYIHNPYDEYNYVTSVHPAYYSKLLKNYTDKLVYIPYFVLAEPDPKNPASIEGISHFAQTPGVLHADEVWVQSENMRLCYVEAMCQWCGENTRKIWEKKILAKGSPKFDKVADTRKEDLTLPEDWIAKIRNTDGTDKKVILYNTGVSALLKEDERMTDKIEDVLKTFYEHKDKVTLLWRPHPLIEATISSMRPKLWERYASLVDKYKKENWGIYDDSPDLNRAIATADAYYGDGSSVVQLCQSVGMPVMIQSVNVTRAPE